MGKTTCGQHFELRPAWRDLDELRLCASSPGVAQLFEAAAAA